MRSTSVLLGAVALFAASALARAGQVPAAPAAGAPGALLPPDDTRDLTIKVCSGCHSPDIAARQRLSKQGWADVVEVMAGNGAQATDAEFARIADYLARAFPHTPAAGH